MSKITQRTFIHFLLLVVSLWTLGAQRAKAQDTASVSPADIRQIIDELDEQLTASVNWSVRGQVTRKTNFVFKREKDPSTGKSVGPAKLTRLSVPRIIAGEVKLNVLADRSTVELKSEDRDAPYHFATSGTSVGLLAPGGAVLIPGLVGSASDPSNGLVPVFSRHIVINHHLADRPSSMVDRIKETKSSSRYLDPLTIEYVVMNTTESKRNNIRRIVTLKKKTFDSQDYWLPTVISMQSGDGNEKSRRDFEWDLRSRPANTTQTDSSIASQPPEQSRFQSVLLLPQRVRETFFMKDPDSNEFVEGAVLLLDYDLNTLSASNSRSGSTQGIEQNFIDFHEDRPEPHTFRIWMAMFVLSVATVTAILMFWRKSRA